MDATDDKHFDVIVIGTGPGGEGAAMQAVKHGKRVGVVERYDMIGGGCTHSGTIPSKALRFAIFRMTEANQNPLFRAAGVSVQLSFAEQRGSARSVIARQTEMRRSFYDRNRVDVIPGHARFVDPHRLEVEEKNGAKQQFTADAFIIATGSRPFRPAGVDFKHPRIFESDTILGPGNKHRNRSRSTAPAWSAANIRRCFGISRRRSTWLTLGKSCWSFSTTKSSTPFAQYMRDLGVVIRHNESFDRIRRATLMASCSI